MKIQQLIEEQMREFDKKFVVECPTGLNKGKEVLNPMFPEPIKSFLSSYGRKLIEAVGEEVIDKDEANVDDDDDKDWDIIKRNGLRAEQRLKLKEIINSLK